MSRAISKDNKHSKIENQHILNYSNPAISDKEEFGELKYDLQKQIDFDNKIDVGAGLLYAITVFGVGVNVSSGIDKNIGIAFMSIAAVGQAWYTYKLIYVSEIPDNLRYLFSFGKHGKAKGISSLVAILGLITLLSLFLWAIFKLAKDSVPPSTIAII